jgi:hypothetical protein
MRTRAAALVGILLVVPLLGGCGTGDELASLAGSASTTSGSGPVAGGSQTTAAACQSLFADLHQVATDLEGSTTAAQAAATLTRLQATLDRDARGAPAALRSVVTQADTVLTRLIADARADDPAAAGRDEQSYDDALRALLRVCDG